MLKTVTTVYTDSFNEVNLNCLVSIKSNSFYCALMIFESKNLLIINKFLLCIFKIYFYIRR